MAERNLTPELSQLDTRSLEALLRAVMESDEEINVDKVRAVAAELNRRSDAPPVDVDAQWNSFLEDYVPNLPHYGPEDLMPAEAAEPVKPTPTPSRKRPRLRIALIAAIIVILALAVTVSATLSDSKFWKSFSQWSNETFGFSFGQPDYNPSYNPEYIELRNALIEAGVTLDLVPAYLPEGYVQTEFAEYEDQNLWVAGYQQPHSDNNIVIQIRYINNQQGTQFEKAGITAKKYTVNGVDHYIMPNHDVNTVVWVNDGYECSIMGTISESELRTMIDSVYYYVEH